MVWSMEEVQRTSAYGFVLDAGRVLMVSVRRDLVTDERAWMLPGGGVEHGEHPEQTVVREFKEETGLDVSVDRLCHVGSDHRMLSPTIDWHCVYLVYTVSVLGGVMRPEPDGSCTDPTWVPVGELGGDAVLESIKPGIEAALAGGERSGLPSRSS